MKWINKLLDRFFPKDTPKKIKTVKDLDIADTVWIGEHKLMGWIYEKNSRLIKVVYKENGELKELSFKKPKDTETQLTKDNLIVTLNE